MEEDLQESRECNSSDTRRPIICGVDEAGRGPLAGPVVAAAVILCRDFLTEGLDDSKCLSPAQRELLRIRITESPCVWGIGVVSHEEIDRINILQATFWAMRMAVEALGIVPDMVLVDGHMRIPGLELEQRAIIGGDGIEPAIAAASIMAKTHRDGLMAGYALQYPGYGFEKHKGYATAEHVANLYRLGPCPIHRKSFYPVSTFFEKPEG